MDEAVRPDFSAAIFPVVDGDTDFLDGALDVQTVGQRGSRYQPAIALFGGRNVQDSIHAAALVDLECFVVAGVPLG